MNCAATRLEMRPVFHRKDDRIRSHVFVCVPAYYLQWHLQQRLEPLFAQDGNGEDWQWTFSNVMERLKALRRQRVKVGGIDFDRVAEAEEDQKNIIDLLKRKQV